MQNDQVKFDTHLDTAHTTVSLVNSDLAKALVAVGGTDSLDLFNLLGDELGHAVLEGLGVGSLGRGKAAGHDGAQLMRSALLLCAHLDFQQVRALLLQLVAARRRLV